MKVDYVTHSGDDLLVVNAARVSFSKHKTEFDEDDSKLLNYLARHRHWTPFAHPSITLRMKAPIFVRTQCFKHKQGFVENEVSRRYVDDDPEFYIPDVWRGRPVHSKQGSSDVEITELPHPTEGFGSEDLWGDVDNKFHPTLHVQYGFQCQLDMYHQLLKAGVAPEQARMVLPQSMYTEWYWTGSLAAYARFYKQRTDEHAQKEIQDLAHMVGEVIEPLFPMSWRVLTTNEKT